jgi:ADP-ribosylglycohydrolase
VGDAFGQRFFFMSQPELLERFATQALPDGPWPYTDDSEMADALTTHLLAHGLVEPDALAARFAQSMTPDRGYGAGAAKVLGGIADGGDWRSLSHRTFGGVGSFGNGGAMRVAPLGAWCADRSLHEVAEQARLSAQVTHAHPEGVAGAVAVAVGTAAVYGGHDLYDSVIGCVEEGYVKEGLEQARELPRDTPVVDAAVALGNGSGISAPDTVPFCVWVAALGLPFEQSMWMTVSALGDRDTTCAIVAGLMSGRLEHAPSTWVERTELVPELAHGAER